MVAMNLRQSQEQQAKRDLWNNRRLAEENVVFCIRGSDLVDSPFHNGLLQWELPIFFVADRKRQTMKLWLSSTQHDKEALPTKWDDLLSGVSEWPCHNVRLIMNVPGNAQKGYHFEFGEAEPDACPCKHFASHSEVTVAAATALPEAQIVEGSIADVDQILSGMGFEPSPPATEAQKRKLLAGATALKASNIAFDPGNLETMTSGEAETRIANLTAQLDALRVAWMQKSAIATTDKL